MRITRTEYLNKLIAFKDKQLIKVVTGIRRCGKSVLMEMYQDWLLQNGVEQDQIIAINFEDMDFEELTDYRKLYAYLKDRLVTEKMTYIFLDEIQHVTDFPKVIDSLYIKKNVDIYVTGSNAYMLSSEIATLILNSTPFVRQYGILSNKWGVLLCQKEYQTNDIRQNSKSW